MRKKRGGRDHPVEAVAGVVDRLAVLLGAGVPPAAGWRYLAESMTAPVPTGLSGTTSDLGTRRAVRSVVVALDSGLPLSEAIAAAASSPRTRSARRRGPLPRIGGRSAPMPDSSAGEAWTALAAAWQVASDSGAPVAACLVELAETLRSLGRTKREIDAALAGPRASAIVVGTMPLVGLLFGTLLGFDTLGVLLGSPAGIACLVLGFAAMGAAWLWTRVLLVRATPRAAAPGLSADLVAVAIGGGGSLSRARAIVSAALERFGVPRGDDETAIAEVLDLASRSGAPAARLLRSEAEMARRRASSAAQRAAGALSVTLMMPLGVCVLPAFMLLGVAPAVISIVSSTIAGF